jgi:hypothetical protein
MKWDYDYSKDHKKCHIFVLCGFSLSLLTAEKTRILYCSPADDMIDDARRTTDDAPQTADVLKQAKKREFKSRQFIGRLG